MANKNYLLEKIKQKCQNRAIIASWERFNLPKRTLNEAAQNHKSGIEN